MKQAYQRKDSLIVTKRKLQLESNESNESKKDNNGTIILQQEDKTQE